MLIPAHLISNSKHPDNHKKSLKCLNFRSSPLPFMHSRLSLLGRYMEELSRASASLTLGWTTTEVCVLPTLHAGISAAARSVFFTIFLLILVEALDSLASLSTSLNGCVWSTGNDAKDSSGDPTSPSMDQVLYIFGIAFTQICSGRRAGRRVVSAAGSSSAGGWTIGRVG